MMRSRGSTRLGRLAFAAGLALSGGVRADYTSQVDDPTHWVFRFQHVPDLDQRRSALPNDGRAYCVPTTALDWLAYLTNHGHQVLAAGPHDWEAQANYDLATQLISVLASPTYMNTDPVDGTDTPVSVTAIQAYIGDDWVVSSWIRNQTWSPGYEDLAAPGLAGALLIPGVGWYLPDGNPCPDRHGGHAFAVKAMERDGGFMRTDIHDPATDEGSADPNDLLQSPFTQESYFGFPVVLNPYCSLPSWQPRSMFRLVGLTRQIDGTTAIAYLDYVRSIFPRFYMTALQPFELHYVAQEVGYGLQPVHTYMTPGRAPIMDAVLRADLAHSLVILGTPGDTALWVHTPAFDQWEQVDVGGNAPSDVACGRHREAYVVTDDGTRLACFDIDTLAVESEVMLPAQAQALTYHDPSDEVIVLSLAEHAIVRYAYGLQDPATIQFPGGLPFGEEASIACDPTDGAVWCIVDGDPAVYRVEDGSTQVVSLPGAVAPSALDFDDSGRLFVSDQDLVMEYVPDGEGAYEYPPDPAFPGRGAGHVLSVARSRTNFEPDLVDETWYDEPPTGFAESVPECAADVTGDYEVDVDDLVAVIAAWSTADPEADVDHDGTVNVNDLVLVIVGWGPC